METKPGAKAMDGEPGEPSCSRLKKKRPVRGAATNKDPGRHVSLGGALEPILQ